MATVDTYLSDWKTRILAMCEECITSSAASSNPLYVGATFPYWVCYLSEYAPQVGRGQEESVRPYVFTIEYIIGHLTAGYEGENADRLYTDEPTILNFFLKRPGLQSMMYPTAADFLDIEQTRFTRSAGLGRFMRRSGVDMPAFGTIFTLVLQGTIPVESVYG